MVTRRLLLVIPNPRYAIFHVQFLKSSSERGEVFGGRLKDHLAPALAAGAVNYCDQ